MTKPINNSALSLMWALGGVFQAIIQSKAEAKDIADFQKRDAKENPPPKRVPKLLRQYNKRYTHIASVLNTRVQLAAIQARKAA